MASVASNDGFLRTKTQQEEEKDKELESLVSYLLGDEDAFQDLQNLTVPLPSSPLSTDWDPMELLSESNLDKGAGPLMVEEMLTSEDLNVQPLLSDRIHSSETFGKSTDSGSENVNPGSENINPGSGNEILSSNFNPTSCASVLHDHTYSKKTVPESSMLSFVGAELPPDASIADDTEESNSSDAGYDTMSSSSPGSKFDPLSTPPTSSPPPPLALQATPIIDPVKLIDERIKYFMSKQQEVNLTEEEKETLRAEGLPIPTTLPLTKTEEKALKTVRRKIRNKAAAQESRNKKKKYMESLEERLKSCTHSNKKLMKKVETLETENHSLRQQLAHLQALVVRATNPATLGGRPVQFGSCLMVIVLCFGILFGNLLPYKVSIATDMSSSTTATVRSRSLLSVDSAQNTWSYYWEYFYSSLLPGQLAPPTKTSVPHRAHVNYLFEAFYYDNETTPTSSRI